VRARTVAGMDKQKIGVVGALIVAIALLGGIYLTAKGIAVPAWLAGILGSIGMFFTWLMRPPGGDAAAAKPPSVPPLPLLVLTIALTMLVGCAGSFEEARLVSHPSSPPTTVDERAHCYAIDNSRIVWGGAAKALGAAAGGTGLASLPLKNETMRDVALGVALGAGIAAAGAVYLSEQRGEEWARDCQ